MEQIGNEKASDQQRLVLAINPVTRHDFARPEADVEALKRYLSSAVGIEVAVELRESYEETLAGMERREIDVARLGPYAFVLAQTRFGARALANTIDIVASSDSPTVPYRSVIVARADSDIKSLVDVKGQKFGFVDRNSTTGYLVATFLLQQAGLDPVHDIQPAFLLSHSAVIEAVERGEVAAGAVMQSQYVHYNEQKDKPPLTLLSSSALLSRGPIAIRPNLPAQLERKLLSALLQIHQATPDAARLLLAPTQRFTPASQREMTLKTIAELVGVSYATVSRAINGHGRIAPATMARILKLVEELGYRPNASARDLHKSRGDLVGLLIPDLSYPGLNGIVSGIQASLDQAQMQLIICPVQNITSESGVERQKAYFDLLYNNRIEGLLLTQWSAMQPETLELSQSGRPTTLLEQDLLSQGLRIAIDWFQQQGCEQFFLFASPNSILEPTLTRSIFKQLTGSQGRSVDSFDDLIDGVKQSKTKNNLPGVLCTGNLSALELREYLAQKDLRPLILTIGKSSLIRWTNIPALAFDEFQMGQLAAQRLLKKLHIDDPETKQVLRVWIEIK
jgi:phosphate/phosphite/phosphonate ABC transporter binding protein